MNHPTPAPRRMPKAREEKSESHSEVESEDSEEGVALREERFCTPAIRNLSTQSVGKQGREHAANVLLSRESVDSAHVDVLSEPAEALETEEKLDAATSVLTCPVAAPRRRSSMPNAGQHSNLHHEPRSVLDFASISPTAVSQILADLSSVLFREAVKEIKSTLVVNE